MDTKLANRKGMIAGSVIALSVIALVLLASTFTKKKPIDKPIIKTASVSSTLKHKKRVLKQKAVKPVSAPEQMDLVVRFPEPTENTIQVSGNAQLLKMDAYQNPLKDNVKNWNCVIDRTTSLIWEVKTSDQELQDEKNYYSWFDPGQLKIGGDAGLKNNGNCRGGISCDTSSYVQAINKAGLCGFSDWRLPTRKELMSLVQYSDSSEKNGLINREYFPRGSVDWYWSSDTDADDPSHAWFVLYYNGRQMKAPKSQAKRIRLVRKGLSQSLKNFADNPGEANTEKDLAKDESKPQSNAMSPTGVLSAQNH